MGLGALLQVFLCGDRRAHKKARGQGLPKSGLNVGARPQLNLSNNTTTTSDPTEQIFKPKTSISLSSIKSTAATVEHPEISTNNKVKTRASQSSMRSIRIEQVETGTMELAIINKDDSKCYPADCYSEDDQVDKALASNASKQTKPPPSPSQRTSTCGGPISQDAVSQDLRTNVPVMAVNNSKAKSSLELKNHQQAAAELTPHHKSTSAAPRIYQESLQLPSPPRQAKLNPESVYMDENGAVHRKYVRPRKGPRMSGFMPEVYVPVETAGSIKIRPRQYQYISFPDTGPFTTSN